MKELLTQIRSLSLTYWIRIGIVESRNVRASQGCVTRHPARRDFDRVGADTAELINLPNFAELKISTLTLPRRLVPTRRLGKLQSGKWAENFSVKAGASDAARKPASLLRQKWCRNGGEKIFKACQCHPHPCLSSPSAQWQS